MSTCYPARIPEAERRAMVEQTRGRVTLDGHPAYLNGIRCEFASVVRLDGHGGEVFYAWPTVKRVLASGGEFRS